MIVVWEDEVWVFFCFNWYWIGSIKNKPFLMRITTVTAENRGIIIQTSKNSFNVYNSSQFILFSINWMTRKKYNLWSVLTCCSTMMTSIESVMSPIELGDEESTTRTPSILLNNFARLWYCSIFSCNKLIVFINSILNGLVFLMWLLTWLKQFFVK